VKPVKPICPPNKFIGEWQEGPIPSYYELLPPLQKSMVDILRKPIRNVIAWLQSFWPLWQMRFQCGRKTPTGESIQYNASEGIDWWLPRLKRRISVWNEEAGNPEGDKSKEMFAYYVRIK